MSSTLANLGKDYGFTSEEYYIHEAFWGSLRATRAYAQSE